MWWFSLVIFRLLPTFQALEAQKRIWSRHTIQPLKTTFPELEFWKDKPEQDIYSVGLVFWQIAMNGGQLFPGLTFDEIDNLKYMKTIVIDD